MGALDSANWERHAAGNSNYSPAATSSALDVATQQVQKDTAALEKILDNPKSSTKAITNGLDRLNASTDIHIKTLLRYLDNASKGSSPVTSSSTQTLPYTNNGQGPQIYSGTFTNIVPAIPPLPPPPPPPTTVKIKSATPEIVLWDEGLMPVEIMVDLIFEDIGGQELLSLVRHDTVNGDNVSNQLIKNLTFLNQEYSSKKIISLQNTSDKYFSNFSIKLESKIPFEGNGSNGSNIYVSEDTQDIYIELVNLEIDEMVEVQIGIGGTIYTITLGAEES